MSGWNPIETAPKDRPFWLATQSGGALLEAWHWCQKVEAFRGCLSGAFLRELPSSETYLWRDMDAPEAPRS